VRCVDTDILVRLLTRDDPIQYQAAAALVDADFQLTATVLVETEWVLRSAYGWSREQRVQAFESLVDLPGAAAVPPHMDWILARFAKGADFADMMHIALAEGANAFVTLDRQVSRAAGADAPLHVETIG